MITISSDTLKIMLVDSTYTYDPTTLVVDEGTGTDLQSAEISVTGYTGGWGGSGRQGSNVTQQITGDEIEMALNGGTSWVWTLGTGATIVAAVLIKEGGANDTTSRPIAYFDHDDIETNGATVTISPAALVAGGNMTMPAGTGGLYVKGLEKLLDGTISIASLNAMLLTSGVYDSEAASVADLATNEFPNVTGYTGGYGGSGRLSTSIDWGPEAFGFNAIVAEINNATDFSWTLGSSTEQVQSLALIYETGGNDASSFPLMHFNIDSVDAGGKVTMTWATLANNGNFQMQVAV